MFMTGYSEEDLLRRGTALSDVAVLQKPFVPAVLLDTLARALSAAAK
jgi:CheY-like chemotaxis protein